MCAVASRPLAMLMTLATLLLTSCGGEISFSLEPRESIALSAQAVNSTTIRLDWSALAATPIRYEVYQNGIYAVSVPSPGLSVASLAPRTRYCFAIYGVYFPFGASDRSNEACVTTPDDQPPSAPTGVVASAVSPARVDLAWSAANDDWGVTGYRVLRDDGALLAVAGTAVSDTSVYPATSYCYRVVAEDAAAQSSAPSAATCVVTPADTQAPATPTSFVVDANGGTTATLSWSAVADNGAVGGYRVYRDGALLHTLAPGDVDTLHDSDVGLAAYTQFCYQVSAFDRGGNESAPTEPSCVTTSWSRSVVHAGSVFEAFGARNALAIGSDGRVRVAYSSVAWLPDESRYAPAALRFASLGGSAWSDEQVVTPVSDLDRIALAVDGAGQSVVAFSDSPNWSPSVARSATGWTVEHVATDLSRGSALVIDNGGTVHLVYAASGALRHATSSGGAWAVETVTQINVGASPALALGADGRLHVAFQDNAAQTLNYAVRDGTSWSVETVDVAQGTGYFVGLALDDAGRPHVSHYDATNGDLKLAVRGAGGWSSAPIDSAGNVGVATSIAVDAGGKVHISYSDTTNSRLKYATDSAGGWKTFLIDGVSVANTGHSDTSIRIDAAGRVHIAYFAGASLRYATTAPGP